MGAYYGLYIVVLRDLENRDHIKHVAVTAGGEKHAMSVVQCYVGLGCRYSAEHYFVESAYPAGEIIDLEEWNRG